MDAAVGPELRLPLLRLGAEIVLGEMKPDAAVALASSLIANGVQSDAVLELATLPSDPKRLSAFDVEPLARRMLTELGATIPSTSDAGWIMARFIAEAMISGAIEPPKGARYDSGDCGGNAAANPATSLLRCSSFTTPGKPRSAPSGMQSRPRCCNTHRRSSLRPSVGWPQEKTHNCRSALAEGRAIGQSGAYARAL